MTCLPSRGRHGTFSSFVFLPAVCLDSWIVLPNGPRRILQFAGHIFKAARL